MYCCKAMKALVSAREPGFFVRIEPSDADFPETHWLVFESASEADRVLCANILSTHLRQHPEVKPETTQLVLGTRIALRYCPWCGKRLMLMK